MTQTELEALIWKFHKIIFDHDIECGKLTGQQHSQAYHDISSHCIEVIEVLKPNVALSEFPALYEFSKWVAEFKISRGRFPLSTEYYFWLREKAMSAPTNKLLISTNSSRTPKENA